MTEEQKRTFQENINQMERVIQSFGEALKTANTEIGQKRNDYQNLLDTYATYPMNQIPFIDFQLMDISDRIQELELRISNYERALNNRKMFLKKFKMNTGME